MEVYGPKVSMEELFQLVHGGNMYRIQWDCADSFVGRKTMEQNLGDNGSEESNPTSCFSRYGHDFVQRFRELKGERSRQ